ncbi:OmpA family protein [Roseicitreum antarcticum]|uniref:OmpA family protein n=2 Tax=Roseicitreum antarcticum TaxID=564137 RepID=A0A1H2XJ29_9RHOB|nr:OmpA family protein [Roseicitreum antarcticum]SDW92862.1 OmpA family protein [Roseicitreum antarcticum]
MLQACGPQGGREAGSDLDDGTFGNPTMNNHLVQTGQIQAQSTLLRRFEDEVPSTITFAFDSATPDAEARAVLARQAGWMRQFPEVRFTVYGHTDAVGSSGYNYGLGLRRAQAVVRVLGQLGISRSRLDAVVSQGETRPLIVTEGRERRNRRTVTEVTGFMRRHPTVMNGEYAQIVFRQYVASAAPGE